MSLLTISVASLFFVSASTSDHSADQTIERLATWMQGDFSNMRFIIEHGGSGQPPILLKHRVVREEQGRPAIVVQQSWLSQPQQGYRFQLLRFQQNRDGSIQQMIYPLTAQTYAGVLESSSFSEASLENLVALEGCEVRWTASETEFLGERRGEYCSFIDEYGEEVHWQTRLTLNPYQYAVDDVAVTSQGEQIIGQVDGVPVVNERIRFFTADIQFLPAGANASDDEAWISASTRQPLNDHEQRVALMDADGSQFFGHEIQVLGNVYDPEELRIRIYRSGEETPLTELHMAYSEGNWQANSERVRLRLQVRD
ncbi:hypothetical protein CWE06_04240 [Aliidiomarina haloalkalitolerans]|uniref:Uncharacterized protein n=2 Tax=Aliidiomarina haloalkalitolerans TaxID=859059 RepID=A0A432VZG6_9GAMM|nr:hypothetical protein CWE06_04240 [Aliidiomarina haloalkalitolerans]